MTPRNPPPRFVPTLTEVVRGVGAAPQAPGAAEDQLVQRVLQRVDLVLQRRLREAIATVVLEQTRNLGPALREEIEAVVRQAVTLAITEEQASQRGSTPRD